MSIYITVLILLSLAVTFPLVRGYLRKQKVTAVTDNALRRNKATSRRAVKQASGEAPPAKRARLSFKAASVHGRPDCCQAAKDLEGTLFLMEDLPTLPLEVCDRLAHCQCSFTQHSDRRNDDNRRGHRKGHRTAFEETGANGDSDTNRRSGLERRSGFWF